MNSIQKIQACQLELIRRGLFSRILHLALDFSLSISARDRLAFVILAFAPGHGNFDFCTAIDEIHAKRHDGNAFLPDVVPQLGDFFLVEQKFSASCGFVILAAGRIVGCDVRIHQPGFHARFINPNIGFLDADVPTSDRFDFTSEQYETCLVGFENVIVMPRLAVGRNDLFTHGRNSSTTVSEFR